MAKEEHAMPWMKLTQTSEGAGTAYRGTPIVEPGEPTLSGRLAMPNAGKHWAFLLPRIRRACL